MTNRFPSQGDSSHTQEIPEEDADGNGQFLKVIPVDIHTDEQANERSGGDEQGPVPLPATTDGIEAALAREICLSMLSQDSEVENESDSEGDGKANADVTASTDGEDSRVALGIVDKGAVLQNVDEQVRSLGHVAPGAVGDGLIAVPGVVPVLEGGEVEVKTLDDSVVLVIALGPWPEVARLDRGGIIVDAAHDGQLDGSCLFVSRLDRLSMQ